METNSTLVETYQHKMGRRLGFFAQLVEVFGEKWLWWWVPWTNPNAPDYLEPVYDDPMFAGQDGHNHMDAHQDVEDIGVDEGSSEEEEEEERGGVPRGGAKEARGTAGDVSPEVGRTGTTSPRPQEWGERARSSPGGDRDHELRERGKRERASE